MSAVMTLSKATLVALAFSVAAIAQSGNPASPENSAAASQESTTQSATSNDAQPVRVSQGISQGLLIHKVAPVYPQRAIDNHIQGTVVFQARIGRDGHVQELRVLKGPLELVDAAKAVVTQWVYKPYYLNGVPTPMLTTINVNFPPSP